MTKPGVFRVGDRVRIRGFALWQVDGRAVEADGLRAAVAGIGDYFLIVAIRGLSGPHHVFPSQCRKIVPKKRREWKGEWHKDPASGTVGFFPWFEPKALHGLVGQQMTLREVRKP